MKHSLKMRVLSMLLALVMVIGMIPTSVLAEETDGTVAATEPAVIETSEPETSEPETSESETSEPETSEPETSEPEETESETTEPEETESETTEPEETVSETTEPEITETEEKTAAYAVVGGYDTTVSDGYYNVLSSNIYNLAPGAIEREMILNNADSTRRQIVHVFEVDATNPTIQIVPGYYGIDKLNPDDLAGDGPSGRNVWTDKQLTQTVAYYEDTLNYNVVGAMNTALAYDSNAPYGYMVWNGVVLGTPEVHKGAQTYLAIYKDGTAQLRSMSTPLDGNEWTAISANFGWLVKDGELVTKTVERTTAAASRSMIGIKADGTLVFCQVDGRLASISVGLSNYEMGEMMLALGCVNAVNCDGGGSSTFVSKREGTTENVMRSIPSDGSERATINSVIIASTAMPTGKFDHAVLDSVYDYIAPGATMAISASGVDPAGFPADIPAEGLIWEVSDESMGFVNADGVFTAGSAKGDVVIMAYYDDALVGEMALEIVDPAVLQFREESTVVPYGKAAELAIVATYGADNWAVCVDGAYTLTLSDAEAGTIEGNVLTATNDGSKTGVDVTMTYNANPAVTDLIKVTYGKGSEIIFDFEDGDVSEWMGFEDAKQWSIENNVNNTLVGAEPLAGQMNDQISSDTFLATRENGGQVRSGKYALAWALDNTNASFASWSYNVLFNVGENVVLRDVANGQNATRLGMWLYIPEGATGLAFQSQFYTIAENGAHSCKQDHFTFTTASGEVKNLNSCTEADIPESRWVYASIDLSKYDYLSTGDPTDETNSRSPSFIRTYVKPMLPAVHTFYIDDITLDYSSAVDDRVLPVISNATYATADESVAMQEGVVINGNSVAFTAKVSDNAGLNTASGAIYVDGIAVPGVKVSNGYLSGETVTLTSGAHTVSFEIEDKMGNPAKLEYSFTVAGDPVITLAGHNDLGNVPEYDSIYYVDINVADITAIDGITAKLDLQNANTWEPAGITAAEGFKVSYSLNEITNRITVTVKKDGVVNLAGAQTLVSIPVRVWSWDGFNYVTETEITPDKQYATGNWPIVSIQAKVAGSVAFSDSSYSKHLSAFGGSIKVDTMVNDMVNPLHVHTVEALEDLAATCTTDGYTGRTYCHACGSVIAWGTTNKASGHTYTLVDEKLVCHCGEVVTGTGLVNAGEDIYYLITGTIATGWQSTLDGWYYADPTTKKVVTGQKTINGLTYTFDETGLLTAGVWVTNDHGTRYNYGPGYYTRTWQEIDGKTYYFGRDTYMYTGINFVKDNPASDPVWYDFGETGGMDEKTPWDYEGLYDLNGNTYFIKDGISQTGLQYVDGYFYYFDGSAYIALKNKTHGISNTNGLTFADGTPVAKGTYTFDEEGRMIVLEGLIDGYYYAYGKVKPYAGLIKHEGCFYYITDNGAPVKDRSYFVSNTNGLTYSDGTAVAKGTYDFDAEGKMKLYDGLVDGVYYVKNVKTPYAGLIKQDGYLYYISDYAKPVANKDYFITKLNDVTYDNGDPVVKGTYTFDAEGKMVIKQGLVDGYYYVNNVRTPYAGLIEHEGDLYYISDYGAPIKDKDYFITKLNDVTYDNGDPVVKGTYTFDSEGKMVIKDGLVDGVYYENNVKVTYAGLIEHEGNLYYISDHAQPVKSKDYFITRLNDVTYADGTPVVKGTYTFDSEGKMVIKNGLVDGYYYVNNVKTPYAGLIKHEGSFYYISDYAKPVADRTYYITKTNGLTLEDGTPIEKGNYVFEADGKMIIE